MIFNEFFSVILFDSTSLEVSFELFSSVPNGGYKVLNLIQNQLNKQGKYSITENGAIGYRSTGSALVDINYKVSSLRQSEEEEIINLFDNAFKENREYALKWLFFARDILEGLGERRLFRICYKRLAQLDITAFKKI